MFLDLKYYDILNIVVCVVCLVVDLGVWMVDFYVLGGLVMME